MKKSNRFSQQQFFKTLSFLNYMREELPFRWTCSWLPRWDFEESWREQHFPLSSRLPRQSKLLPSFLTATRLPDDKKFIQLTENSSIFEWHRQFSIELVKWWEKKWCEIDKIRNFITKSVKVGPLNFFILNVSTKMLFLYNSWEKGRSKRLMMRQRCAKEKECECVMRRWCYRN